MLPSQNLKCDAQLIYFILLEMPHYSLTCHLWYTLRKADDDAISLVFHPGRTAEELQCGLIYSSVSQLVGHYPKSVF